jgi:hypothetical protein
VIRAKRFSQPIEAPRRGLHACLTVGVVLLVLILGWATMRIVRRPERTVWVPEAA